jgi:hypothetical protein
MPRDHQRPAWQTPAAASDRSVIVGGETDGGRSCAEPSGSTANTFSGGQRSVAVSGSTVYMVWNGNHTGDDDVYLAVSRDRGVTIGADSGQRC